MRKLLATIFFAMLLVVACSPNEPTKAPVVVPTLDAEYGNPQLLVDVDWVRNAAENPDVVLVDLRSEDAYTEGHIPGAVQLDLTSIRATVDGVDGQVAAPETVANVLGEHGIASEDTVVAYDDADGLDAARFFWTLEYYGHRDVRLLNGGWPVWQASTYPVSDQATVREAVTYTIETQPQKRVDAEWILTNLEDPSVVLVDARSPAEYSGEEVRSAEGGHIPGAFNRDWHMNLEDGFFKGQDTLESLYQELDLSQAETIVTYCQTGHRASVAYFTLRLMGYDSVAVYDGSWEEWGNLPDVPHTAGSEPQAGSE